MCFSVIGLGHVQVQILYHIFKSCCLAAYVEMCVIYIRTLHCISKGTPVGGTILTIPTEFNDPDPLNLVSTHPDQSRPDL